MKTVLFAKPRLQIPAGRSTESIHSLLASDDIEVPIEAVIGDLPITKFRIRGYAIDSTIGPGPVFSVISA